jgi:hypothetical protein
MVSMLFSFRRFVVTFQGVVDWDVLYKSFMSVVRNLYSEIMRSLLIFPGRFLELMTLNLYFSLVSSLSLWCI